MFNNINMISVWQYHLLMFAVWSYVQFYNFFAQT